MRNDLKWKSFIGSVDISKVKQFEIRIGYSFPNTYKDIVTNFDGASLINNDSFNYYSEFSEEFEISSLGMFFRYSDPKDEFDEVERMEHKWNIIQRDSDYPFPKNIVPFSRDGAGNYICFDYRKDPKTNNPPILFWFHEVESGGKGELSFIANSFDELLDMLFDDRTEDEKKEYEEFMKFSILD